MCHGWMICGGEDIVLWCWAELHARQASQQASPCRPQLPKVFGIPNLSILFVYWLWSCLVFVQACSLCIPVGGCDGLSMRLHVVRARKQSLYVCFAVQA